MKFMRFLTLLALLTGSVFVRAEDPTKPAAAAADTSKKYHNVGVEEFDKLRTDKKNVVLDVRAPKEYAAGHLAGAVNIDWNGPDFGKKLGELDKSKTYLVHCAGGVRSAKASDKMSQLNFKSVYNLEGGMKAWEKAGKRVEK